MRKILAFLILLLPPASAVAQYTPQPFQLPSTGVTPKSIPQIMGGIVNVLHGLAIAVVVTTFLIGGIYVVASGGRENVVQNGKSIMKASLIGIAIIMGSWLIISTLFSFLS